MESLKGSFLVAEASLMDPNFRRTVVLVLDHGPAGAYGVVVNRPAKQDDLPLPVFDGGPCPSPGLVMLHGHADWLASDDDNEPSTEERQIGKGIYLGDGDCLARAAKPAHQPMRFRLIKNYAGWGPGQLEQELAENAWRIIPASAELLFDELPENLWLRLRSRGIPEPSLN